MVYKISAREQVLGYLPFLFCEIQWIGERAEERSSSRKDSLVVIHIPGSDWPMQSVQG